MIAQTLFSFLCLNITVGQSRSWGRSRLFFPASVSVQPKKAASALPSFLLKNRGFGNICYLTSTFSLSLSLPPSDPTSISGTGNKI